MRKLALLLAGALLLTSCGSKDSNDGSLPVPVGGDSGTTTSATPTTPSAPTTEPSTPATTKPAAGQQIYVVAGNYADNPAVQGLVDKYPLYFQALITKDETVLKKSFPAFWYADVSQGILDAQQHGWVMRPPGSIVVLGVKSQPDGTAVVTTCRSQTTEYWDPKAKNWTVVAPKGSPEVIIMVHTGLGWLPYRLATTKGVNCAGVHYPA